MTPVGSSSLPAWMLPPAPKWTGKARTVKSGVLEDLERKRIKAANDRYRARHAEAIRARQREWVALHAAERKAYRDARKAERKAWQAKYYAENRERIKAAQQARRARERAERERLFA